MAAVERDHLCGVENLNSTQEERSLLYSLQVTIKTNLLAELKHEAPN